MILETKRLILRPWCEDDAEDLYKYASDPEASREMLRHAFEDLGMKRVRCGYYDGNVKSRRVQEKPGFVYHHTTEGIELAQMNETRTGHVMLMTRAQWEQSAF